MHEVLVYNKTKTAISERFVRNIVFKSLAHLRVKQPIEVAVLFVGDMGIRHLNKFWREKDQITNVLSFPQLTKSELKKSLNFGSGSREKEKFDFHTNSVITLGEIIIDPQEIFRAGAKKRKKFDVELKKLVTHGLLHLLGYDHKTRRQETRMLKKENELLKNLNSRF